jgi:hypothetical protein
MKELKASMNMKRASRTYKQSCYDNKDRKQEYMKQHREDNKEILKEKV